MTASLVQQLDGTLDRLFAGLNFWSYLLTAVLLLSVVAPLFFTSEPDTHPLLLARQAAPSAVRQPGESSVYRSLEAPHGYPLRAGLEVRDPGAPKWSAGRDGDLRDIWKEALLNRESPAAKPGRFLSVKGRNEPVDHSLEDLTKELNAIGQHIQASGATRVAIYLPNSTQFLITLFAAAFYNFVPILIPLSQPLDQLSATLRQTKADALVTAAGILTPDQLSEAGIKLKDTIWVIEETSRHLDWTKDTNVSDWHKIVEKAGNGAFELPSTFPEGQGANVIIASNSNSVVEFTQKNIVAGVAAQINALPRTQRMSDKDTLVSLEPLTSAFALTVTLAAMHSHATIALTTVAGASPDFDLAFQKVTPTLLITTPETLSEAHARKDAAASGLLQKLQRHRHARTLAAGAMIQANSLKQGLRVIYTSSRVGEDSTPLTPNELQNMRILTGARIVNALTAPQVAGSVAQTNALDYRVNDGARRAHFGAPVSSVELKLVEGKGVKIPDDQTEDHVGEIVVTGPSVVGGQINLGVLGKFGEDQTLRLA